MDGRRAVVTLQLNLDARLVAMAEPMLDQVAIGRAATWLADDVPNDALTTIIGAALEAACRADEPGILLAMGGAVSLLKAITEAQMEELTP